MFRWNFQEKYKEMPCISCLVILIVWLLSLLVFILFCKYWVIELLYVFLGQKGKGTLAPRAPLPQTLHPCGGIPSVTGPGVGGSMPMKTLGFHFLGPKAPPLSSPPMPGPILATEKEGPSGPLGSLPQTLSLPLALSGACAQGKQWSQWNLSSPLGPRALPPFSPSCLAPLLSDFG